MGGRCAWLLGGACVVAPGGGGMHGCSGGCGCSGLWGGMHGCSAGGGMCGCSAGGAYVVARGVCMVFSEGDVWFFPGGHAWFFPGEGMRRIQRDTVNERAVRILLECILVVNNYHL